MAQKKNGGDLFITKLESFYDKNSGSADLSKAGFATQNLMFMFTLVVDLFQNGDVKEIDATTLNKINAEYVKLFDQFSPQSSDSENSDDDTSSCFDYPENSPFSKQNKRVSEKDLKEDTNNFFNFFRNSIYADLSDREAAISKDEKNQVDKIFDFDVDVEEKNLFFFKNPSQKSNSMGTVSYPVLVSLTSKIEGRENITAKFLDTTGVPELEFFDSHESSALFLFENIGRSLLYFHVFYRNLYTKKFYNSCKKISKAFEPTDEFEQDKVLMRLLLEKSCESSENHLQIERYPFAKDDDDHFFLETMAYSIFMAFEIIGMGGAILDSENKINKAVDYLKVEFFRNKSRTNALKKTTNYFKERNESDYSLKALPALKEYS